MLTRQEYNQRYYATHKEYYASKQKEYRLSTNGKARRKVEGKRAWDSRKIWERHGLTKEQHEAILIRQDYKCPICLFPLENDRAIDHDHACCDKVFSCGKCVRGILHKGCNRGMGQFLDDSVLLRRAAEYLDKRKVLIKPNLFNEQEFDWGALKAIRKEAKY